MQYKYLKHTLEIFLLHLVPHYDSQRIHSNKISSFSSFIRLFLTAILLLSITPYLFLLSLQLKAPFVDNVLIFKNLLQRMRRICMTLSIYLHTHVNKYFIRISYDKIRHLSVKYEKIYFSIQFNSNILIKIRFITQQVLLKVKHLQDY